MRQLPPLAAVRVFEAAARHGNFTRAAAELGMTQAAVSHQVKLLEDRVGGRLFQRTAKGAALTDLGARLAPGVTTALDALARSFAEARGDGATTLSISSITSLGTLWLAPRLGRFMAAHPGYSVRLDVDNAFADFAGGRADVGLRSGRPPWPGLMHHLLFHWHCSPMLAPDVLERHGPVRVPADLLRLPRAVNDDAWWTAWFAKMGVDVTAADLARPSLVLEAQALEGAAAMAGQGVAMLTPAFWRRELAEGRLVQPFAECAWFGGGYYLVYPDALERARKVRDFAAWLGSEAVDLGCAQPSF